MITLFFIIEFFTGVIFAQPVDDCKITKTAWTDQDETGFQNFVYELGNAVETRLCNTVEKCMKSSANPFRRSDPEGFSFKNDCSKLGPMLRTYYACKNGLPMSLVAGVVPRKNGDRPDIRYTGYGNKVVKRQDFITPINGKAPKLNFILNNFLPNVYSSAVFRTFDGESDAMPLYADYYSPEISRKSIRAGTIVYDPNGHVVVVYKVNDDGRIHYIDSHPDSSLTRGVYGKHFMRSRPEHGAGFKNWRPIRLVDAVKSVDGIYVGGKIIASRNVEIASYSAEQFYGNSEGKFIISGQEYNYYDYLRIKMSKGDFKLNPINEIVLKTRELCNAVKDRVQAVEVAVNSGIHLQPHPARLPENIYGTSGNWEVYSTPSRDARLKVQFIDLLEQAKLMINQFNEGDSTVEYNGNNLPFEMLTAYENEAKSCLMEYRNSKGQMMKLNLEQIRQRLYKLSFDPYHCSELRWGASGEELQTCPDDANKILWYNREQTLRNQHLRNYDVMMNFTLDDLATFGPGKGSQTAIDVDLPTYLRGQ